MMTIAEKLAVAIALVVIVAVSSCAARTAKERATTADAGGGRLNIKLTPQGAADLAAIQAKHPGMTKTEVIHNLMRGYMLD